MFLYQSNRLEKLFRQLCDVIQRPVDDPLTPEIIVVHNQGMAQWVSQQIAFTTGIAANLHFPLPGRFVWDLFRRISGDGPEEDLFAKPVLRWRINALLPQLIARPAFGEIAAYLRDDPDGSKKYQLAGRIGDVLDQYLVYRPDLLTRWEEQIREDDPWQALLWRQLTATAIPYQARLPGQFRRILDGDLDQPLDLPQRFHLFGINSLAPVYLDILERVSKRSEVYLYHLSPCRHYWGDLVSARQLAIWGKQGKRPAACEPDAYYDQGHPLLVSLGRIGQDFFRQLLDCQLQEVDLYQENGEEHLLAFLHNDILDLMDRSASEQERLALDPGDRSLQFHICFSPLREIQVLHDRLLDLFQLHPDLTPGDILVTAPDIQIYAGAIAGVFGEAGPERRIPWSIADQSLHQEQPVVRCFLDLLTLLGGRFTAPSVLALCETEALRKRFGLDPAILPRLHTWVRESGIRWGLDQAHRQQLEVHPTMQHSWRFGLDRLLLGYLMGECDQPYGDLLPYPHLGGNEAGELGGFVTLIETLSRWHRCLQQSYNAEDWCRHLLQMVAEVFAPDPEDLGLSLLREAFNGLKTHCQLAGYTEKISPTVVKHHLEGALSQPDGGQPFLSGRVTFCNMVPMRSVPFRVICLLGMNDGAFPRAQHPVAFDLMAQEPRLGDRNRRHDDRYLFLEALLSARDVLYISWTGRNQRDDSVSPPSVVVSELQDYLNQGWVAADPSASAQLTTLHPMQPFSPRCFDGTVALASYNTTWQPAGEEVAPPPFLPAPLAPPGPEWRVVELSQLVRFWRHPVRFFLQEILGMQLRQEEAGLEESEPFLLDSLQQYHLRQETIRELLLGQAPEMVWHNLSGSGRLPQAGFGQAQFTGIAEHSAHFVAQLHSLLATPRPPLEIDRTLGPFQLTGWLTDLYEGGRITWRSSVLKGADLIELWILHLLLNLQAASNLPLCSIHVARATSGPEPVILHTLRPVAEPERFLRQLLDLYWQGLSAPLHFFPETSRAWAEAAGSGDEMQKARQVWEHRFHHDGEGEDPAYGYCFRQTDPLDEEFIALTALFAPILAHLEGDDDAAA